MSPYRMIVMRDAVLRSAGSDQASWYHQSWSRLRVLESLAAAAFVVVYAIGNYAAALPQPDDADFATSDAKTRPALAQDFRLSNAGEVIFSAYTGAPYTYPSDVTFKKPGTYDFTAKDVTWIGEPFDNPIYYGLRIARWAKFTRTGWMVDFTHSKAIADPDQILDLEGTFDGQPAPQGKTRRDLFHKLEASHGHNMLTFNGMMRTASIGARLHPYVGLGAGISLPHSEVHFVGNKKRTYEYQYAGPVGQALFGIEFRLARSSVFLEYKFTYAPYEMPLTERNGSYLFIDLWAQLQNWWSGTEPPGGRLTTTYASHQLIGGIGIRVVPVPTAAAAP